MNEILINIISVIVTAVVLPLISLLGTKLISWISSKIKNEKASKLISDASSIVLNAVSSVFQTYVESLKKEGDFNKDAQVIALTKAKDIAINEMSEDIKEYIEENYGTLDTWLTTQIEASINLLKN